MSRTRTRWHSALSSVKPRCPGHGRVQAFVIPMANRVWFVLSAILAQACIVAPCPKGRQCDATQATPQGSGGSTPMSRGDSGSSQTDAAGPPDTGPVVPWENITPSEIDLDPTSFGGGNFGINDLVVDPTNPSTVFMTTSYQGFWRSTDSGLTFTKMNTGRNGDQIDMGRGSTLAIDPGNPSVLYTISSYGGLGIWKTTNAGVDWDSLFSADPTQNPTKPINVLGRDEPDIAAIDLDPQNSDHLIATFHDVPWRGYPDAGLIETLDGGKTWRLRPPPTGFGVAQCAYFLDDSSSWLVMSNSPDTGTWRTTDGGEAFVKIDNYTNAGACQIYRAAGALYVGSGAGVLRSVDHGATWKLVTGRLSGIEGIVGDGNYIYASEAYPLLDGFATPINPTERAVENPGTRFRAYGTQTFSNGGKRLAADRQRHIIFSAAWGAGVFRLVTG
jgi:hypothetical protein